MFEEYPRSTVRIGGHPIHPMLVPFPIALFFATLVTDIVYWQTADIMWADFSDWLLTVGLIISIFVVLAGLGDFFGDRRIRALPQAWIHGLGNALALVLAIINAFVHTRDAYTSVVPQGLILSALVVLILLVTVWMGRDMVFRGRVGMQPVLRS